MNRRTGSERATTPTTTPTMGQRLWGLLIISTPLLVGFLFPGTAIVALTTPALTAAEGQRAWPTKSRTRLASAGLGALTLAWLLPLMLAFGSASLDGVVNFEGLGDNLLPLCGYDIPYLWSGLLPGVVSAIAYLSVASLAVAKEQIRLWLLASLLLPLTFAFVQTQALLILGAEVVC